MMSVETKWDRAVYWVISKYRNETPQIEWGPCGYGEAKAKMIFLQGKDKSETRYAVSEIEFCESG